MDEIHLSPFKVMESPKITHIIGLTHFPTPHDTYLPRVIGEIYCSNGHK